MTNKSVLQGRSNSEYYEAKGMQTKRQEHCGGYHDQNIAVFHCRAYYKTYVVERFAENHVVQAYLNRLK